uniref:Uncharacterized protein n=1 Tax=Anguilla anguilla TaxID=7936 RepID=A0A0E9R4L0_ANGAN
MFQLSKDVSPTSVAVIVVRTL